MTVRVRLDGNFRTVDKGIADVVKELNKRGFKTVYSCSSLREDHPWQAPRDRSDEPYVCVEGKHPELIEIAEASGWNWEFSGYGYTEDGIPVDHIDFRGKGGGQVVRIVERALEKPGLGPDGGVVFWQSESETTSSKEEAIQNKVEFTQLILDSGNDKFIKQGIARLLEAITQKCV